MYKTIRVYINKKKNLLLNCYKLLLLLNSKYKYQLGLRFVKEPLELIAFLMVEKQGTFTR